MLRDNSYSFPPVVHKSSFEFVVTMLYICVNDTDLPIVTLLGEYFAVRLGGNRILGFGPTQTERN